MKYKVGDFVHVLVARDSAIEGDVGVIDAVHKESSSYTVGFYAAEDCLVGSARFYEEELSPYHKQSENAPFHVGDIVLTLEDNQQIQAGSAGEIIAIYPKSKGAAVQFEKEDGLFPTILPYSFDALRLLQRHEHH